MRQLDNMVYDLLFRASHEASSATSGHVVVIDLDEKSLAEYGQWPWPRYRVALLLAQLHELGVRAVGLDILFAESDATSPVVLKRELERDLGLSVSFDDVPPELMDNDAVLARVLANGSFVLGYNFYTAPPGTTISELKERAPSHPLVHAFITPKGVSPDESYLETANAAALNLPMLQEAAKASGYFSMLVDDDGVLRRTPLIVRYQDTIYPSLALATLLSSQNLNNAAVLIRMDSNGVASIQIGDRLVPLDSRGCLLLNYPGESRTFTFVSAADVLANRVPEGILQGKVALLGSTASGLMDARATPLDPIYPGVEAHATIIDNIIQQNYLWQPSWHGGAELAAVILSGVFCSVLLCYVRALHSAAPVFLLVVALGWGALKAMEQGIYLSPLYPVVLIAILFTSLTLLRYLKEEHQKRFFETAFSSYVSPQVVEQMVRNPDRLSLTGEEKEVTVLFTDLRDFTSFSESLDPERLSSLLNAYFTPMTHIITERFGTLDKYIGDAIMAFWNAPLNVPDHPTYALNAALEMVNELNRLNETLFQREFGTALRLGAGLHCGSVRVGNMGTDSLFNYTIIGDAVNLASRLEGLTKYYGVPILVSNDVALSVENISQVEIDTVRVKGKEHAVTIYTPQAVCGFAEHLHLHQQGLELYKNRRFVEAAGVFRKLSALDGHSLHAMYEERAKILAENPPPKDWDMVFTHTSK